MQKMIVGALVGLGINFVIDYAVLNIAALSSIATATKDIGKLAVGGTTAYLLKDKHEEMAIAVLTATAAEPFADGMSHLLTAAQGAPAAAAPTAGLGIVKAPRLGIVKAPRLGAVVGNDAQRYQRAKMIAFGR